MTLFNTLIESQILKRILMTEFITDSSTFSWNFAYQEVRVVGFAIKNDFLGMHCEHKKIEDLQELFRD